jgi:hypothetical protein
MSRRCGNLAANATHTFVDVGYAIQKGKLVRYVRCTKCGLLMEKGKPLVQNPAVQ